MPDPTGYQLPKFPQRKQETWGDEWEEVANCTYRLKVPGGWLVRYNGDRTQTMAFVPKPYYIY